MEKTKNDYNFNTMSVKDMAKVANENFKNHKYENASDEEMDMYDAEYGYFGGDEDDD